MLLTAETAITDLPFYSFCIVLMFYSFFFMGAFGADVAILVFGFFVLGLVPDASFVYLTVMAAIAIALFLFEGTSVNRKLRNQANAS